MPKVQRHHAAKQRRNLRRDSLEKAVLVSPWGKELGENARDKETKLRISHLWFGNAVASLGVQFPSLGVVSKLDASHNKNEFVIEWVLHGLKPDSCATLQFTEATSGEYFSCEGWISV